MRAVNPARTRSYSSSFKRLLGAQFVAQAADGLAQAAFAERLILEPRPGQETPGRILALFAFTLVPYSVVAPFLGVLVDRWDRRKLLVGTNIARALLLVTLPLWAGALSGDAALYAAVLMLLGVGRLFLTTKGAVLPRLAGKSDLVKANALSGGGGMISALLGGAVGIGATGLLGTEGALIAAGVAYGVAATVAAGLPAGTVRARGKFWSATAAAARDLRAGLLEIRTRAPVVVSLAAIFVLRTVGMVVAVAVILVIKSEFPAAGDRLARLSASGLALGAAGAGAFTGAIVAGFVRRRYPKAALVIMGYVISGIGVAALGGLRHLVALLGLTFVGGFGGFVTKVAVDALLQESLPDSYRGRGFAVYDILYNLASVAAAALVLIFADTELRALLVVVGITTLVLAAPLRGVMKGAAMYGPRASAP